jgi:hypothetical protein
MMDVDPPRIDDGLCDRLTARKQCATAEGRQPAEKSTARGFVQRTADVRIAAY